MYTWRNSPYFSSPYWLPFVSPSTYLAPSSCNRNRPPQSQVACKLTPLAPPFTQPTPPLQIPRTPTAQRLTKTTSGIFRLLLTGTLSIVSFTSTAPLYVFIIQILEKDVSYSLFTSASYFNSGRSFSFSYSQYILVPSSSSSAYCSYPTVHFLCKYVF
jgi:hypothetical protein